MPSSFLTGWIWAGVGGVGLEFGESLAVGFGESLGLFGGGFVWVFGGGCWACLGRKVCFGLGVWLWAVFGKSGFV